MKTTKKKAVLRVFYVTVMFAMVILASVMMQTKTYAKKTIYSLELSSIKSITVKGDSIIIKMKKANKISKVEDVVSKEKKIRGKKQLKLKIEKDCKYNHISMTHGSVTYSSEDSDATASLVKKYIKSAKNAKTMGGQKQYCRFLLYTKNDRVFRAMRINVY